MSTERIMVVYSRATGARRRLIDADHDEEYQQHAEIMHPGETYSYGNSATPVCFSGTPTQSGDLIVSAFACHFVNTAFWVQDQVNEPYVAIPPSPTWVQGAGATGTGIGIASYIDTDATPIVYAPTMQQGQSWAVCMVGFAAKKLTI